MKKSQTLRDKIICLLIYPGAKDKSFGDRADEILAAIEAHDFAPEHEQPFGPEWVAQQVAESERGWGRKS
jgi:hypothetical protein